MGKNYDIAKLVNSLSRITPNFCDWEGYILEDFSIAGSLDKPINHESQSTPLDVLAAKPLVPFPDPIYDKRVATCLKRLPRLFRTIIRRCLIEGANQTEVAKELGVSRQYINYQIVNPVESRKLVSLCRSVYNHPRDQECSYCKKRLPLEKMFNFTLCEPCHQVHQARQARAVRTTAQPTPTNNNAI